MLSDKNQGHLGQCKKERTKSKKYYPIAVSDERIYRFSPEVLERIITTYFNKSKIIKNNIILLFILS